MARIILFFFFWDEKKILFLYTYYIYEIYYDFLTKESFNLKITYYLKMLYDIEVNFYFIAVSSYIKQLLLT